jgi:hypothetical protein
MCSQRLSLQCPCAPDIASGWISCSELAISSIATITSSFMAAAFLCGGLWHDRRQPRRLITSTACGQGRSHVAARGRSALSSCRPPFPVREFVAVRVPDALLSALEVSVAPINAETHGSAPAGQGRDKTDSRSGEADLEPPKRFRTISRRSDAPNSVFHQRLTAIV